MTNSNESSSEPGTSPAPPTLATLLAALEDQSGLSETPQTRFAIGGEAGRPPARQRAGGHPTGDGHHPGRARRRQSDRRRHDAQALRQYPLRLRRGGEGERAAPGQGRAKGGLSPDWRRALRPPFRDGGPISDFPAWAASPARKISSRRESTTKSSMGLWPQSARVRFTKTPRRCIGR